MADVQREGLVRHLGLSEVGVEEIEAAERHFRVATVQNLYNLANRQSEAVVDYCTGEGSASSPGTRSLPARSPGRPASSRRWPRGSGRRRRRWRSRGS